MKLFIFLKIAVIVCSCSKGLPPPLIKEVSLMHSGNNSARFLFNAPNRGISQENWDYKMGVVLPKGYRFDLAGEVRVFTELGNINKTFRFDSAVATSWLRDGSKVLHILVGDLGIEDGKAYRIELILDHSLNADAAVVMYYHSR